MFKLTLVTPQKKLLTEVEVEEVIVPAFRGQLDILPRHAPLMTTLQAGQLKIRLKGETRFKTAIISWGYCEVNPNGVVILTDTAEWPEEINRSRAEENLKIAQQRLTDAGLAPDEQAKALRKIDKEKARLALIQ
jgi:F-type H+-transporting ATPase subunit epsilon